MLECLNLNPLANPCLTRFCSAAVAARLPRSGVRRDWMALKLVRERAAAAAFARRQLAKSQLQKERRKAGAEGKEL